eukprot:TRINITY_DN508_c0_g1_i4.p1 TRINITY_DN508_c0_g1~~TRINITY_DN508_c0_g1_i4.p1  ORF type:complete len:270 (+),score=73.65 TRINITY_DN508_c0_g1_i4:72-881(+)
MRSGFLLSILLLLLSTAAWAHLCMFYPPPRGPTVTAAEYASASILAAQNKCKANCVSGPYAYPNLAPDGYTDNALCTPCGGNLQVYRTWVNASETNDVWNTAGTPTTFVAGSTVTLKIVQNAVHGNWAPTSLVVEYATNSYPNPFQFNLISEIPDAGRFAAVEYNWTIPSVLVFNSGVLRVTYKTNSTCPSPVTKQVNHTALCPGWVSTGYTHCADIAVVSSLPGPTPTPSPSPSPSPSPAPAPAPSSAASLSLFGSLVVVLISLISLL